MQSPDRRAAGSAVFTANNVANPTNLTPVLPTSQNGDLLLCFAWSRSITATVGTPSGWTLLSGFPLRSGTASGGSLYVFARVQDGTGFGNPTVTWTGLTTGTTGDASGALINSYTGCDLTVVSATGFLDGAATSSDQAGSTTTVTVPSITPAIQNSLRVAFVLKLLEGTCTWTPPASFTEDNDVQTTTGTGHSAEISHIVVATPGATGTTTAAPTLTTSSRALGISFAIKRAIPRNKPVNYQNPGFA